MNTKKSFSWTHWLIFGFLFGGIIGVPTEECCLGIVVLELDDFFESFSFDEHSQGPTESNFHDICFKVIVWEPEIEEGFGVFLDAGNECLLEEVVTNIFEGGVLVGGHGLVETLVVIQVVFLVFFAQADR